MEYFLCKLPGMKSQKQMEHLGYFYQKRIIAPKVLPNFGILFQKGTLVCSLQLSPNLGTKIPLSTTYFYRSTYGIFCTKSSPDFNHL